MWILVYFFMVFSIAILVFGFFLDLTIKNREKRNKKNVEMPVIGPLLLVFTLLFLIFMGLGSGKLSQLKNIRFIDREKFYPIKKLVSSPEIYIGKDVKTEGRFFFLDSWRNGLYIWDGENEIELVYSNVSDEEVQKILRSDLETAYINVSGKLYVYSNTLYPFIEAGRLSIEELDIPFINIKALQDNPEKFFGYDVKIHGEISKYDGFRIYVLSGEGYEIPVAFVKLPVMYRDYLRDGERVGIVGEVKKDKSGYYLQLINISFLGENKLN